MLDIISAISNTLIVKYCSNSYKIKPIPIAVIACVCFLMFIIIGIIENPMAAQKLGREFVNNCNKKLSITK